MGLYYYAIDTYSKKYFSPPEGFSIKSPGCFHPYSPFPNMIVMKNIQGYDFEIWNDGANDIPPEDGYQDITDEVYLELKETWPSYDWDKAEWKDE